MRSASANATIAKPLSVTSSHHAKHVYGAGNAAACAELDNGELVCSLNPGHGCVSERMRPPGVQGVGRSLCAISPSGAALSLAGNGCELDPASGRLVESPLTNGYGTCALAQDGVVSCASKLGKSQQRILTGARELSAGGSFFCALRVNREVWCWGSNVEGGLGDGRSHESQAPVRVRLGKPALSLTVGGQHACVVSREGSVDCWGENSRGAVGVGHLPSPGDIPIPGSPPEYLTPQHVVGLPPTSRLSTMSEQTCALTQAGQIYCWGQTPSGEAVANATRVDGLPPVAEFAFGIPSCAITLEGETFCWGDGCPLAEPSLTPQKIDWRVGD
jgi:Regulator of Chromosome Condensation (RCC1) repeat protein